MCEKIKPVSVVMCTYNGEKYLREQLDSIVKQTYPIYELIIQDDCSTDSTINIIEEYVEKYSFISLFINETNKGVNYNFISAFYRANGDYIAVADQDDIWLLDKIEILITNIGDYSMAMSNSLLFGNKSCLLYSSSLNVSDISLLVRNCVVGHTLLFKKNILPEFDIFIKSLNASYDALLGFLGAANGGGIYVNKILTLWRRHESCVSYKENTKISIMNYFNSNNYSKVSLLFSGIHLFFNNKRINFFVDYFISPSIFNLLKCGIRCIEFEDVLYPDRKTKAHRIIGAFFTPFFAYRNYINNIVLNRN